MPTELARALLNPKSIALIGASNDPRKNAGRPLDYLRRAGFAGAVYPVNQNRSSVQGERAWRSLADLPDLPDHAFILTATEAVSEMLEECARAGVKVATILASGFGEIGQEGLRRENDIRRISRDYGIRVVGPSSLGIVNLRNRMILTANAAFAEELPVGRVFCASQSGSIIGALASRAKAQGFGFSGLVSVGNEVDLGVGEICMATLDDPDIDSYMLFMENLRGARKLREFALAAAKLGKPVVAFKLGRSEAARELSQSHTGAMAGEDDIASAFFADCGIARVETFSGLVECLPALRMIAPSRASSPKVGIVSTTGAGAAMVVDQLGLRGIDVVPPTAETAVRLKAAGIDVNAGRIVDLTLAGARFETVKTALEILLADPDFDLLIAVIGSSARLLPESTIAPILELDRAENRLAVFIVPDAPETLFRLRQANIPSFGEPEVCADVVAAALRRSVPRLADAISPVESNEPARLLDELRSYSLLDTIGIPRVPAVEIELNVTTVPELPFGYPVAVKVLSSAVAHKSDIGGVVLNVTSAEQLVETLASIRNATRKARPDLEFTKATVQPMARGIGEVLLGYRIDPDVGPVVLLAPGGILAELSDQRSLRMAPVSIETAHEMIGELAILRSLAGFRNMPKGDLDGLAKCIAAFSRLAVEAPLVTEAEINPLFVHEQGNGVLAVDAVAWSRDPVA